MIKVINILIILLGTFAVGRIIIGLILANVWDIMHTGYHGKHRKNIDHQYKTTVIVPAFNEEKTIQGCVESVVNQTYPRLEIIVVDDGSTDRTPEIIDRLAKKHPTLVKAVHQANGGKSHALNNALRNYVHDSEIVMVLDADSQLAANAVENAQKYFNEDPKLIAIGDNVRIKNAHHFLEYVQETEYLLGYRLKGSEPILGLEYIIGGIGSVFRYEALKQVGFYDEDTVTEDIDLTMKLLHYYGNKNYHFGYAADVIAYTPPVHNFPQLLKQRYRWKYGRFKALLKHKAMIFNHDRKKYTWTLTNWKLPKVFFEEFMMLIDPIMLIWMFTILYRYLDATTFTTSILVFLGYAVFSILNEKMPLKQRLRMLVFSPFAYFFLYVINLVDYISLIHCIKESKQIVNGTDTKANWVSPDR